MAKKSKTGRANKNLKKAARSTKTGDVSKTTRDEIAKLAKLGSTALNKKYEEVLGRPATSFNVLHLRGAIAKAFLDREGGTIPEPKPSQASAAPLAARKRDPRLPAVGTVLERTHEGVVYKVKVLDDGFEYDHQQYRSLSAIAKAITGTTWNGFLWFGFVKRPSTKAA